GVGTLDVEHRPGIDRVALRLRHLLAVLVDYEPEHVEVLERGGRRREVGKRTGRSAARLVAWIGHQRRQGVKAVEPASCLVYRFTDVISREALRQAFLEL